MPMRNIYTSPLSLKKKKCTYFYIFSLYSLIRYSSTLVFFHFFLSSSFPSFLQKKGAQKKKKARGFCVERSKAIQHTRARNEYISSKSHHHCRSKDDEGKRYNNAHTRERDVLRDDVRGGEKRERCREPSSFVVVVYVVAK